MSSTLKRILILAVPFVVKKLLQGKKVFKFLGLALLLLIGGVWFIANDFFSPQLKPIVNFPEVGHAKVNRAENTSTNVAHSPAKLSDIRSLYESRQSGSMVYTAGYVTRILADDNDGSRHQRFILDTPQQLSVLVTHNIDLAQRVPILVRDQIAIYGQYEWNEKGGVIHWTHHDPKNIHPGGWILHKNEKYE